MVECRCNHLTSFAILTDASSSDLAEDEMLTEMEHHSLSVFVYVCVSISIACLLIVIAVYATVRSLRSQTKTILLNLCSIYALALVLFMASALGDFEGGVCVGIGASLHFALLSTFFWMLVEGRHLYMYGNFDNVFGNDSHAVSSSTPALVRRVTCSTWCPCLSNADWVPIDACNPMLCATLKNHVFRTFVKVFEEYRSDEWRQLKLYSGVAYGIPAFEVLVVVCGWPSAYTRDDGFCFLSKHDGAIWAFFGTALVVIVLNIYVLVMVSRVVWDLAPMSSDSKTDKIIYKAKRAFKSSMYNDFDIISFLRSCSGGERGLHHAARRAVLNGVLSALCVRIWLQGVWQHLGRHLGDRAPVARRADVAGVPLLVCGVQRARRGVDIWLPPADGPRSRCRLQGPNDGPQGQRKKKRHRKGYPKAGFDEPQG